MAKTSTNRLILLGFLFLSVCAQSALYDQNEDGSEQWGYVEVRPKAHMFWWLYKSPQRDETRYNGWPLVLWLQGGPGSSGVGMGNFVEVGPLDINLKPRNSTWLQIADLLFVDNPVGTGFSYVEDEKLLVKSDYEAARDLTTLLKELFNKNVNLQRSPLFIVAESYGGKYAVTLGLSIYDAIEKGELKLMLGGIALGDSWISPEDFVLSWGPLLKDISRLDDKDAEEIIIFAQQIKQQIANGQYEEATSSWSSLESLILIKSNNVDLYNFLLDIGQDPVASTASELLSPEASMQYSRYLSIKESLAQDLNTLMDTVIRKKLKIIPESVLWGGQSDQVFSGLVADFMKPRIQEVDDLLAKGGNITIYNGQLDLICATKGTEAWMNKLKWEGMSIFKALDRTPLFCDGDQYTKGFMKSYKNLHFFWILGAGHFVPVDQPCTALKMLSMITQSPIPSPFLKAS